MKILIVDDNRVRHELLLDRLGESDAHHAYTIDEAFRLLSTQSPFDMVHLDWDMEDPLGRTGVAVAEFIVKMPQQLWPEMVNCHSHNEDARRAMARFLKEQGVRCTCSAF